MLPTSWHPLARSLPLLLGAVIVCSGTLSACSGGEDSNIDERPLWAEESAQNGVDRCGDGVCGVQEACFTCPADCGACDHGDCGDGICTAEESCHSCPADCGGCDDVCGDGVCDAGEDCSRCEADCGVCEQSVCGDARCDADEDCEVCPSDCGICSECGDDVCSADEDCESCAADCGVCPDPCGDGVCAEDENCAICESDCGTCAPDDRARVLEEEIFDRVNAVRAAGADCPSGSFPSAPALSYDENLAQAARLHSIDMGTRGYFEHDNLEGQTPSARMTAAGYTGSPGAENIAAGNGTAAETMDQWMNSDGHCRNIMNASLDDIGVGYAFIEGSPYRHYWTQNFGRR